MSTTNTFEGSSCIKKTIISELRAQQRIIIPLAAVNLTWFANNAVTTFFLGRLGELQLAGGILGLTFANVTGFSVLIGLCGAMEPICGQGNGAGNHNLLRKTFLMCTLLLLSASLPISLLWLNLDKILVRLGQHVDIVIFAKQFVTYLLPGLVVTSHLYPLKAHLSAQEVTVPIMVSSFIALAFHVPINIVLARARGIQGVAMAVWISDFVIVIILAAYVYNSERTKKCDDSTIWWHQELGDWIQMLRLSVPCCLTKCLEWWCWEILVLLTGRLVDAEKSVSVIAVVLNFDYLPYSVTLSLATCVSVRVSNKLGAGQAQAARDSAYVSLGLSIVVGLLGAVLTITAKGHWGLLFSHNVDVVNGVKKAMMLMALVEVANTPLAVCGGIVRGTSMPWIGMCASLGGFYLVALPLGTVLAFKTNLELAGLLLGFIAGATTSAVLLVAFVVLKEWDDEAKKAMKLAGVTTTTLAGEKRNGINEMEVEI